jgi:hypothetical protein
MLRPLCSVWNGTAYWPLWWLGVCCFVCFVGGFSGGVTPGPFPNPEAKPACADGTAPGRVWESRTPPAFIVILRSGRTIFGLFFHSSFLCVCRGSGLVGHLVGWSAGPGPFFCVPGWCLGGVGLCGRGAERGRCPSELVMDRENPVVRRICTGLWCGGRSTAPPDRGGVGRSGPNVEVWAVSSCTSSRSDAVRRSGDQ